GSAKKRENLRLRYSWAIKHYLGKKPKSYETIAEESGVKNWTSVRDGVDDFIYRLPPPELLSERLQTPIKLLLQAAALSKGAASKIPAKLIPQATIRSVS